MNHPSGEERSGSVRRSCGCEVHGPMRRGRKEREAVRCGGTASLTRRSSPRALLRVCGRVVAEDLVEHPVRDGDRREDGDAVQHSLEDASAKLDRTQEARAGWRSRGDAAPCRSATPIAPLRRAAARPLASGRVVVVNGASPPVLERFLEREFVDVAPVLAGEAAFPRDPKARGQIPLVETHLPDGLVATARTHHRDVYQAEPVGRSGLVVYGHRVTLLTRSCRSIPRSSDASLRERETHGGGARCARGPPPARLADRLRDAERAAGRRPTTPDRNAPLTVVVVR